MSFGLGFWANTAGGGAAAGAYEQIATAFGDGTGTAITFASIPSTYRHLQIRGVAKNTYTVEALQGTIRLNGVSTTNYDWHLLRGNGTNVVSSGAINESVMRIGEVATSNTTNAFNPIVIDILDYTNTSKNTTIRTLSGANAAGWNSVNLSSGLFRNTNAITQVDILFAGFAFATGSRFSLYGIRG